MMVLDTVFEGGILINTEDLVAAGIAALLVLALALFFQKTPTGRALRAVADDHQAAQSIASPESHLGHRMDGRRLRRAGRWRDLGLEAGCPVLAVADCVEGTARRDPGGFTSVPGAIIGGLIIGVGEKFAEVFLGPIMVKQFDLAGGGIENWFAYVLALLFLLVRPEGLFGEKHIDRV